MHHGKQKMTIKEIHTNPDIAQELHGNVIEVYHIDHDNYAEYIGKTVKVIGDVELSGLGFTKLPINFTTVGGSFDCSCNELPSLERAPTKVGMDFYCLNNPLKSTKGKPEFIGGELYID